MEDEAGGAGGVRSSAGVKLQVDLGEAAGEDGGPDVVFAAHPENILKKFWIKIFCMIT